MVAPQLDKRSASSNRRRNITFGTSLRRSRTSRIFAAARGSRPASHQRIVKEQQARREKSSRVGVTTAPKRRSAGPCSARPDTGIAAWRNEPKLASRRHSTHPTGHGTAYSLRSAASGYYPAANPFERQPSAIARWLKWRFELHRQSRLDGIAVDDRAVHLALSFPGARHVGERSQEHAM